MRNGINKFTKTCRSYLCLRPTAENGFCKFHLQFYVKGQKWFPSSILMIREIRGNKQVKIKCAAIKFPNGKIYVGKRHHDCFKVAWLAGERPPRNEIQGFMTDDGRFLNRIAAAFVAYAAGQIPKPVKTLFSEDLY